MHQAGTLNGVDIIGGEDLITFRARHLAFHGVLIASEVREHRVVAPAFHLGALEFTHDLIVLAELLLVGAQQRLAEVELLAGELAFGGAHLHIVDVGADHDGEVGRNGPRGGGPEDGVGVLLVAQLHSHGHGGVLTILVHVRVHAQLVRGKRRLILRAVRQHAVALVGQTLVVQLLERPHHGFHVRNVQSLVAVLEVDPARLTVDVILPLIGVLEHGGTAGIIELVDAHFLDLVDGVDAQFLLRLKLCGQTVGIPAEHTVDLVALHGLIARNHILGVTGQQVAVMRQAVGERRAVEEHEFVLAVVAGRPAIDGLLEGIVLVPIVEHGLLQLGEAGVRRDVGALLAGSSLRIHMIGGFAHRMLLVTYHFVGLCTRTIRRFPGTPRYHLACHSRPLLTATPRDRLMLGCVGPIPSVLLGRTARLFGSQSTPFFRKLPADNGSMLCSVLSLSRFSALLYHAVRTEQIVLARIGHPCCTPLPHACRIALNSRQQTVATRR